MSGWIKLHRQLNKHWIWENPDYLKAWISILIHVNFEEKKVLIDKDLIVCLKGQSLHSLQGWAKIFGKGWTIQKVRTFFSLLQKDSMINTEGLRKTTRLTVCNYGVYQIEQQTDNTQTTGKQQAGNTQVTDSQQQLKKDNNYNNDNNEEEVILKENPEIEFFDFSESPDFIKAHEKEEKEKSCAKKENVFETIYPDVSEINHKKFAAESVSSDTWVESIFSRNKFHEKGFSHKELKTFVDDFNLKLVSEGDKKNNKRDWQSHFARNLPFEIQKLEKQKQDAGKEKPIIGRATESVIKSNLSGWEFPE